MGVAHSSASWIVLICLVLFTMYLITRQPDGYQPAGYDFSNKTTIHPCTPVDGWGMNNEGQHAGYLFGHALLQDNFVNVHSKAMLQLFRSPTQQASVHDASSAQAMHKPRSNTS